MREIFGNSISVGQLVQVTDRVTLRNDGAEEFRAVDLPAIIHFTLEVAERNVEAITAGLIAAWLYDKLKVRVAPERKGEKLLIERTEVELSEGAIKKVISERLTIERDR